MAKITSIIDIGSNSMRMVVYEKSSRFGFHVINESKAKIKLAEGSYNNNNNLTNEALDRAFSSLKSFLHLAKNYKSKKIICVATSALRGASNKTTFLNKVRTKLKLNIKIISGEKESFYGALACVNLLFENNFLGIDVGGGSSEICLIENKKIKKTISLEIGTIRLQELYLANNKLDEAKKYIAKQLKIQDMHIKNDMPKTIVVMGGSLRALCDLVIIKTNYSFKSIHGFTYNYKDIKDFFKFIINANKQELLKIGVKQDRLDTITQGVFILDYVCSYFDIKTIITSGVGVRDGVYLNDLLRGNNKLFNSNFNVGVRSLLDRFVLNKKASIYKSNLGSKLFDTLAPLHKLQNYHKDLLKIALKLNNIGSAINFYKSKELTFGFMLNGLMYGLTHEQRLIIAYISKSTNKVFIDDDYFKEHQDILKDLTNLKWLCLLNNIINALSIDDSRINYEFSFSDGILHIKGIKDSFMINNALSVLKFPKMLKLKYIDVVK